MSLLFFEKVLEELGKKLSYDAIVNYAGNSFCSKSWEMIEKANPMISDSGKSGTNAVAAFFENATIIKSGSASIEDVGPVRGKEEE